MIDYIIFWQIMIILRQVYFSPREKYYKKNTYLATVKISPRERINIPSRKNKPMNSRKIAKSANTKTNPHPNQVCVCVCVCVCVRARMRVFMRVCVGAMATVNFHLLANLTTQFTSLSTNLNFT